MNKKYFIPSIGVMIATSILAGCGSSGKAKEDAAVTPTAPIDYTKEAAEIVFYSNNGELVESFDSRMGNALRKKIPNYTIKYIQAGKGTQLTDLITTNTRFDIFYQSIGNFEAAAFPVDIQYDMAELIKKHGIDLSRLDPTVVDAVKQASGGKMYGLPVTTTNLVLYYNKDVFNKFGVPFPKDGMTWDEVMDMNKKLTRLDSGVQYFGFTHSPFHSFRLNPLSIPHADMTADKPTINKDERWKTYFDIFYTQPLGAPGYQDGVVKLNRLPDINDFVKSKTVGMYAYLSSLIYAWEKELKELNWDIVSLPTIKGQPAVGSQSYPSYYGITKMAQNKDAAAQVLKYLVSDEFQAEIARKGTMPVLNSDKVKADLGKESPYADRNWKAIFYNKFAPIPPKAAYDGDLVTAYYNFGNQYSLGKMDMNTTLRSAEEDALKKIEAFKQKTK
ncbi:extracellular solute-binding protein [Paenibacillus mesophilus]|uniref:ABC transporter substrate-binding protein n=1 Tax=Paenibacillus mesophilus TaxID=2582849 RepID=UPI00110F5A06|nr:extracellular solute-binding protein [Paenibacillus mesophilus]TMV44708.1 extracellular solute-binding protein [Paenibacillus mesophilus]